MNYLSAENISKTYGVKDLFQNVTFGINRGQKIALVARNGAGKSTFLKILTGKDVPDSGSITSKKDITIAYLEQEPLLNENKTAQEELFGSDSPLLNIVREYEACLKAQEEADTQENRNNLQEAVEKMDALKAWDVEVKVNQILSKLKINYLNQPISTLSGGQKKRVALSKMLINEPDVLIMDEPTNHLDVEMIEWLEKYLMGKDMTLLLVTHDRYFLDKVCKEIIELDNQQLYYYKGNFSYFLEKKEEREYNENSEIDKARNLYRKELDWMRRMPKARSTKAKARVSSFYETEEKAKKKTTEDKLSLNVKTTRIGGKILELIKLSKAYEDFTIVKNFSYIFKRNEKIGIIGKNGAGKTTLLRMIMGLEEPDAGKIQTGETVVFGYYSQEGLKLNEDKRVIEVVKEIADFIPLADGSKLSASQLLQRFQFNADIQYNYVSKLSGGEKRRLYLLTVLIKNPNFLILDEPTNDLDIITIGILEEFLESFQGCVIIVSHDRYFLDNLADHLFVFEGDGIIKDFPGNYSDYRDHLSKKEKMLKEKPSPIIPVKIEVKQENLQKKKPSFKEKFEYDQLEKEIKKLETEKSALTEKLSIGSDNHTELSKWAGEIDSVIKSLEEKTMRWFELSELI